jgi:pimeloyl-ACP methyl ester carboxylesterase
VTSRQFSRRVLSVSGPDGKARELDVVEYGPASGRVMLFHSGTPSGPAVCLPIAEEAASVGLRYVNYARPGYGYSTAVPGRSVADAAPDCLLLLDQLGADVFVTLGWSGGGPHALSCGALSSGRCRAVAVLAGVAPRQAAGLDWYDGMAKENLEEFELAERRDSSFETWLAAAAGMMSNAELGDVIAAMGELLPPPDQIALAGPLGDYLLESLRSAFEVGTDGWRDDDYAFLAPWGFDVSQCQVPTLVLQGSEDKMVPMGHGRWLSGQLEACCYEEVAGAGHLSVASDPGRIMSFLAKA